MLTTREKLAAMRGGGEVKVYRVYKPFHSDSESGTREYGTFSTPEKATARAKAAVEKELGPEGGRPEDIKPCGLGFVMMAGYPPWPEFRVTEIEVDEELDEPYIGYT